MISNSGRTSDFLARRLMFWKFEVKPEGWSCYTGATTNPERETYATRVVFIEGKFSPARSEFCRINSAERPRTSNRHAILGWRTIFPRKGQFLPKGLPDWYTAPSVHFGELSYTPRNPMSAHPEGLELMGQIPAPVFEEIWGWLKAGNHIECVRCEAFGDQLSAHFGDPDVSWSWQTGESGILLLAGFGISFAGQRK